MRAAPKAIVVLASLQLVRSRRSFFNSHHAKSPGPPKVTDPSIALAEADAAGVHSELTRKFHSEHNICQTPCGQIVVLTDNITTAYTERTKNNIFVVKLIFIR